MLYRVGIILFTRKIFKTVRVFFIGPFRLHKCDLLWGGAGDKHTKLVKYENRPDRYFKKKLDNYLSINSLVSYNDSIFYFDKVSIDYMAKKFITGKVSGKSRTFLSAEKCILPRRRIIAWVRLWLRRLRLLRNTKII